MPLLMKASVTRFLVLTLLTSKIVLGLRTLRDRNNGDVATGTPIYGPDDLVFSGFPPFTATIPYGTFDLAENKQPPSPNMTVAEELPEARTKPEDVVDIEHFVIIKNYAASCSPSGEIQGINKVFSNIARAQADCVKHPDCMFLLAANGKTTLCSEDTWRHPVSDSSSMLGISKAALDLDIPGFDTKINYAGECPKNSVVKQSVMTPQQIKRRIFSDPDLGSYLLEPEIRVEGLVFNAVLCKNPQVEKLSKKLGFITGTRST